MVILQQNLAIRLEDFKGRTTNNMSGQTINNFNGSVTGFQQNNNSTNITQNVEGTNIESELFKQILEYVIEVKEMVNSLQFEGKGELVDNIDDLVEVISSDNPKKNRVVSFGSSILGGMKKMLSMNTFNNTAEISSKLPTMIENISSVLEKVN